MRIAILAAFAIALGTGAAAQTIHLGTIERWFLTLAPMHQARACIQDGDPLRPALESVLHETQAQATRDLPSDFERGMLAGRLMNSAGAAPAPGDEDGCQVILAGLARGLLRLHVR